MVIEGPCRGERSSDGSTTIFKILSTFKTHSVLKPVQTFI